LHITKFFGTKKLQKASSTHPILILYCGEGEYEFDYRPHPRYNYGAIFVTIR